MQKLAYWRAGRELTLFQAALLMIGEDPARTNCEKVIRDLQEIPGFTVAVAILLVGVASGDIKGTIAYNGRQIDKKNFYNDINESKSIILVDSLKEYLTSREETTGFSLTDELFPPDYLNPYHSRYAPKLAAAVQAWIAVGKKADNSPRTPKQLLEEWLLDNAAKFNLIEAGGRPNQLGIDEVAKVANWKPTGGAPKTPTPKRSRT